ncbi:hypothetical protein Zmor_011994 [Zophobas morio]|uniref:J domain-containing protein n=1 Tax=Zophobas morio TaxID=2755281 RepID=A0AA38HIV5_9CUCU|nr:hypothetical protein Zmor_011994 [Zophobas morio]
MRDLYEILGLSRDATERDIQRSYRRLAVRTHPDRNLDDPEQAKAKFQKLNRAKNILSDPKLRSIYDKRYLCCCFCCCLCCTAFRKDDYERDSEWRKATSSSRTSSRSPSLYEPANFGAPSKPTPIPLDAKASPKKFPTPPPTASSSPPPKAGNIN